jgi:eukaryotic-like serine/threonine-protein kinase
MVGKTFLHYQVEGKLGSGGMGEVWRARDTKLNRAVALKVLPDALARDPERMARFHREAQVLASLNHPHIAAIYGLEESGDVRALVMELVEGQTLAELLEKSKLENRNSKFGTGKSELQTEKPAPEAASSFEFQVSSFGLNEALPIARQIAEGLEYAHDRGIIHRDLKPANIKITPEGNAKVLDFGLAKALDIEASGMNPAASPTFSPTLSIAATQAGVILGTAAYMSPEQAKGKSVDRRADIWAFGCVLYEMLTGKRLFEGETVSDTLAAVLRAEPDWEELPASTPPAMQHLLHRCLEKDPKRRLQAIGEARITIEGLMAGTAGAVPTAIPALGALNAPLAPAWRRFLPWEIAGLLFVMTSLLGGAYLLRNPRQLPSISASISLPTGVSQPPLGYFSISPDGRRLAFVGAPSGGRAQLWVRPLDSLTAQPLAGTEQAIYPFWSPDSRYIGFFAEGKLKKIEASGGPAQTLCDAPDGRGGTWGPDGTIVFAPGVFTAIERVASTGGTPAAVTSAPQAGDSDRFPSFLPDGKHILYLSLTGSGKTNQLRVVSLDTRKVNNVVGVESAAVFDPSGYLFYERDGNLIAQRFDKDSFALSGDAVPIVERIEFNSIRGNASFSVSSTGILIYQGGAERTKSQLTWFDRDGKRLGTLGEPAQIGGPSISPDGKRVVTTIGGESGNASLWMFDVARGISSRFTFTDSSDAWPVWSPDGKQVAYSMSHAGRLEIYVKPANGVATQQPLVTGEGESMPTDWSRDGRFLAYQTQSRSTKKFDIWILPLTGDRKPYPFIATDADEESGVFSPEGRWMAYTSDESGRNEVYVVPFPSRQGKWQVSASGGGFPFWAANGSELDYFTPDGKWMAVEVNGKGNDFAIGATRTLFGGKPMPANPLNGIALSADGKKVLIAVEGERASVPFTIITDWQEQLRK